MSALIVHAAQVAALGAGVAVVASARGKLGPAAKSAVASGVAATERAQAALAHAAEWCSDLYAEARAEWSGSKASVAAPRRRRARRVASRDRSDGQTTPLRDASGRFAKRSDS